MADRPVGRIFQESAQERSRRRSHVFVHPRIRIKIPCLVRNDGEVVDGHLRLPAESSYMKKRTKATTRRRSLATRAPIGPTHSRLYRVSEAAYDRARLLGIELDPKYVDVVIERWQTLIGKKAKLEADGRTFEAIKTERVGSTA